jgi:hypothetical protein
VGSRFMKFHKKITVIREAIALFVRVCDDPARPRGNTKIEGTDPFKSSDRNDLPNDVQNCGLGANN